MHVSISAGCHCGHVQHNWVSTHFVTNGWKAQDMTLTTSAGIVTVDTDALDKYMGESKRAHVPRLSFCLRRLQSSAFDAWSQNCYCDDLDIGTGYVYGSLFVPILLLYSDSVVQSCSGSAFYAYYDEHV